MADVWYISLPQTVIELSIINFLVCWSLRIAYKTRPHPFGAFPNHPSSPTSLPILALTVLLAYTEMLQIIEKIRENSLSNLLCPCHSITLLALASIALRSVNYKLANFIFQINVYVWPFTVVAIVVALLMPSAFIPESSSILKSIESVHSTGQISTQRFIAYYTHHFALLIHPFALLFTKTFQLDQNQDNYFSIVASALMCILHWDIELPASIALGTNINFMVQPPPLPWPLSGQFYRLWVCSLFAVGLYILRFCLGKLPLKAHAS